jgi:F0F1-type ATP synthase assembly protein I
MDNDSRPADDLLDVARALLLVQGAILVAATIEAAILGLAFPGGGGTVLVSGTVAAVLLVARARLRPDRRRSRRIVYVVEGITVVPFIVDIALAIALAHALPPAVAILTQLVLPLSVVALLRRSARSATAPVPSTVHAAFGGMS